jgi:tetratricopeptide (TPR) repeat protein
MNRNCKAIVTGKRANASLWKRAAFCLCLGLMLFTLCACSGNQASAYNRAVASFAAGDYEAAAEAFDKLGDYQQSATYAAYSHGLVFYAQGNFAAAEPYFEKSQDFMYGKQRYAYCAASVLQDAGTFDTAAAAFVALGDFEDSALRAAYCKARYAQSQEDYETALFAYEDAGSYADAADRMSSLQDQVYKRAKQYKATGEYEKALNLFSLLGDYINSQSLAKVCKDYYRNQQYSQAEADENSGDLQTAYNLFSSLSGYRDAQARADAIASQLGIDTGGDTGNEDDANSSDGT